MEIVLISTLITFVLFFSFVMGKYIGTIQEKRKALTEARKMQSIEIEFAYDEMIDYDHISHQYIQGKDNIITVYFSKEDLVDDLISNKIVFSPEENKYIKVKNDE